MTAHPSWLRGPVAGVLPMLQPVAHSLLDCLEDVRATLPGLSTGMIAARPNGAASIGFHVRHAMGSLDRLFTYARGEALTAAQLETLLQEKERGNDPTTADALITAFDTAFDRAMVQVRATAERDLLMGREVGRARLPSTVIGLLSHGAEHTQRHVAQMVTTAKIVNDQDILPSLSLKPYLSHVALVVRDYDEALTYFANVLGFRLTHDEVRTPTKRWVVVAPPGGGAALLLARAATPEQLSAVGNQTGGRVFLFLSTDDFWRDYDLFRARGVIFVEPPREEPYGTVAVFQDLYGNRWDLVQHRAISTSAGPGK